MTYTANTFANAAAFLKRAQHFLEEKESVNSLILGIGQRLVDHPDWQEFPCFLSTIENNGGEIEIAAVMTPPKQITLAGAADPCPEAVDALVSGLLANRWQPPGVTAPRRLAEQFARAWSQSAGLAARAKMQMRIYELCSLNPVPDCPGSLRRATEADLETVSAWRHAFLSEALGDSGQEAANKITGNRIAAGEIFLWDDEGPVSMAVRTRPTRHGTSVGGVYTPPEKRRKGYATACVAALSRLILESGKRFCSLFTDLANPTSNAIYMKIGYKPLEDFATYHFEVPEDEEPTPPAVA